MLLILTFARTLLPRALLLLLILTAPFAAIPVRAEEQPQEKPLMARPMARPMTVRMISYNTWLIPVFSKQYEQRRERLAGALASFQAQVICLQEVWTSTDQQLLCGAMKKTHPHAARGRGGLLVLSAYPVASSRFTPYPVDEELTLQERIAGKGYLTVMLTTPAGPLEVVNTHLAAMWGEDNPRTRQLDLLIEQLQTKRPHPLVLTGDLNTRPVASGALVARYEALLATGLTNTNPPEDRGKGVFSAGRSTRVGWPRRAGDRSAEHVIDYILFRSSPTARVKRVAFRLGLHSPKTALSDHQLLLGELRVEPRTKAPVRAGQTPAK